MRDKLRGFLATVKVHMQIVLWVVQRVGQELLVQFCRRFCASTRPTHVQESDLMAESSCMMNAQHTLGGVYGSQRARVSRQCVCEKSLNGYVSMQVMKVCFGGKTSDMPHSLYEGGGGSNGICFFFPESIGFFRKTWSG